MYIQGSILIAIAIIFGSLIEKKNHFPVYLGNVPKEQLQQECRDKDLLILFLLIGFLFVGFLKFSKIR